MRQYRNIIYFFLLFLSSCLDMFDKAPEKFIGNIYMRTSPGSTDNFLIYGENYHKNGTYTSIINEPVLAALGNDSVIYIKSRFLNAANYYLITHDREGVLLKVNAIDSIKYQKSTEGKKFKYTFPH